MTTLQVFEALCGVFMIFIGWRFIRARAIPLVSEGSYTPLGWIKGRDAVLVGVVLMMLGVALLVVAAGFFRLP